MNKLPDTAEFRQYGHALIDRISDYLEHIGEQRVFSDVDPGFLYQLFKEQAPEEGEPMSAVFKELEEKLIPYCTHVGHPGYFGLITPSPLPSGILGDLLASALNQNAGAYTIGPSAVAMERQVIRWICGFIGYKEGAGGNFTSGGMTANCIGLKLARDFSTGNTAQFEGLTGKYAMYVSEERHVSIDKSADLVGLGRESLRKIPTDDQFRVDITVLRKQVEEDIAHGIRPLCIIGLAGTTNTGSIDDMEALYAISREAGCWFHVDAAYGGGMLLSSATPGLLKGIEKADSVTLDPHKWFYAPLDAGAILVKDEQQLTRSFGMEPAYLSNVHDAQHMRYNYYVHGLEQSRRFRSLKVWMSFRRYGTRQIGNWIDENVAQAFLLHTLAIDSGHFKAACVPAMSAVCLRYETGWEEEEQIKILHADVVRKIEKSGRFWISTTELKGRIFFRINPVNYRTKTSHIREFFDLLMAACTDTSRTMAGSI